METLKLTAKDFKQSTSYWKDYIGTTDVSDFQWHIEIDPNLGYCRFEKIKVSGKLTALAGSWIEAGEWIEAGWWIKAGWLIKAGWWIEAGEWIEAGWWIKAGEWIEAGWWIKAGSWIEACLYITCRLSLSFSYKIFAWICYWKNIEESEKTITCWKLEGTGVVEYGILKEIWMPEEKVEETLTWKEVTVIVDWKEYKAIIQ